MNIDPAHVVSRGAGGGDFVDNVMPLCRSHHIEQGQIGWVRMCDKYPDVFGWFIEYERLDVLERATGRLRHEI